MSRTSSTFGKSDGGDGSQQRPTPKPRTPQGPAARAASAATKPPTRPTTATKKASTNQAARPTTATGGQRPTSMPTATEAAQATAAEATPTAKRQTRASTIPKAATREAQAPVAPPQPNAAEAKAATAKDAATSLLESRKKGNEEKAAQDPICQALEEFLKIENSELKSLENGKKVSDLVAALSSHLTENEKIATAAWGRNDQGQIKTALSIFYRDAINARILIDFYTIRGMSSETISHQAKLALEGSAATLQKLADKNSNANLAQEKAASAFLAGEFGKKEAVSKPQEAARADAEPIYDMPETIEVMPFEPKAYFLAPKNLTRTEIEAVYEGVEEDVAPSEPENESKEVSSELAQDAAQNEGPTYDTFLPPELEAEAAQEPATPLTSEQQKIAEALKRLLTPRFYKVGIDIKDHNTKISEAFKDIEREIAKNKTPAALIDAVFARLETTQMALAKSFSDLLAARTNSKGQQHTDQKETIKHFQSMLHSDIDDVAALIGAYQEAFSQDVSIAFKMHNLKEKFTEVIKENFITIAQGKTGLAQKDLEKGIGQRAAASAYKAALALENLEVLSKKSPDKETSPTKRGPAPKPPIEATKTNPSEEAATAKATATAAKTKAAAKIPALITEIKDTIVDGRYIFPTLAQKTKDLLEGRCLDGALFSDATSQAASAAASASSSPQKPSDAPSTQPSSPTNGAAARPLLRQGSGGISRDGTSSGPTGSRRDSAISTGGRPSYAPPPPPTKPS